MCSLADLATSPAVSVKRPRLLLLSYYFPPSGDVGGQRAYGFARDLPDHGFDVSVITGTPEDHLNQERLSALPEAVDVNVVDPWFGGVFGGAPNVIRVGLDRISAQSFDAILATGPPWATLKAGLILSRRTGVPLIADIRDPWTSGELFAVHRRTVFSAIGERIWERAVLRRASLIVGVHRAAVQRIQSANPKLPAVRFVDVELGVEETDPEGIEGLASPFSPETCNFAHFGKLHSIVRPATPLLDGFALAQQNPGFRNDARLHHIGPVSVGQSYHAPPGVAFHPAMPLSEARVLMRKADVLVLLNTWGAAAAAYPTAKIYDYLAARRPILAVTGPGAIAAHMVKEARAGSLANVRDPRSVADGFLGHWLTWRDHGGRVAGHHSDLRPLAREAQTGRLSKAIGGMLSK